MCGLLLEIYYYFRSEIDIVENVKMVEMSFHWAEIVLSGLKNGKWFETDWDGIAGNSMSILSSSLLKS